MGIVLSLAMALVIIAGGFVYADLTHDLPNIQYLPLLLNAPDGMLLQPTRFYDRSGQHLLLTLAPEDTDRRYLPLHPESPQHIPESLAQACVALWDPQFWRHGGFSFEGWGEADKHPTIAQELVYGLLLYDEPPSLRRSLRERLLAAQATQEFGRTQILEWMINFADFGNQAYGAEAAAKLYLGKSATELTTGESALLAATAHAPALNPVDAPAQVMAQRDTTLQTMLSLGMLSSDEVTAAQAEPLPAAPQPPMNPAEVGPAFLRLAMSQLDREFPRSRIERGGLVITTTMDYELQTQAACTTLTFAARLEGGSDPSNPCEAANRLPALPPGTVVSTPSTSAVILDPRSGQVLTAIGETLSDIETATMTAHDPGSLAHPFIYLTAFTRGFSPASLTWDIPPVGDALRPDVLYRGPVRMRISLANDLTGPAETLASQMGEEAILRTETSFGLQSGSATLLEIAGAYGAFATGGVRYGVPGPSTILRVEGVDHSVWLDLEDPEAQSVVAPPLAYIMNNILSDENARRSSMGNVDPLRLDRPAAAKVGMTASGEDSWVVGYTPSRLAVVWVGTPAQDANLSRSPRVVAGLWNALMQQATLQLPADGWLVPAGVTAVDVCDPSGMLPTEDCPSIVSEVFLSGSEPVQRDTLFHRLAVNQETGLLATVFTPPELVEERVYMALPDEALEWATSAGIAVAPSTYDAIQAVPINPEVRISSPRMFEIVKGEVSIRGTASGSDFDRYRVLAGKGLNPRQWIAVTDDRIDPVADGVLSTWDTTGLSGLYAIQLQVIRQDQRIDTAIIQVTIGGAG